MAPELPKRPRGTSLNRQRKSPGGLVGAFKVERQHQGYSVTAAPASPRHSVTAPARPRYSVTPSSPMLTCEARNSKHARGRDVARLLRSHREERSTRARACLGIFRHRQVVGRQCRALSWVADRASLCGCSQLVEYIYISNIDGERIFAIAVSATNRRRRTEERA